MSRRICTATVFGCMLGSIYVSTLIKVPDTVWWWGSVSEPDHLVGIGIWAFNNSIIPVCIAALASSLLVLIWLLADVICSRLRKVIERKDGENGR